MSAGTCFLVFPPLWYYLSPPPDLAEVVGYLRARGHDVRALDANCDATDWLLSEPFLARCARMDPLGDADARLPGEVERAKVALRKPSTFYAPESYRPAMDAVDRAFRLIRRTHGPIEIDLLRFRTVHDEQSVLGCLAASQDPTTNPYVAYFAERVVPAILRERPACVGLAYVHPDQMIPLLTLANQLRAAGSRAHVTVFGSLEDQVVFQRFLRVTEHPHYTALAKHLHSVIVRDPEAALDQLLQALGAGGPLEDVPNLALLSAGKVRLPTRTRRLDPSDLPTPDYTDLDLDQYLYPERLVAVLGSRGCYWDRCSFCAITSNQPGYRARSALLLAHQLLETRDTHATRWVHFRDMLMAPSFLRQLAGALAGSGLRWTCRARLEPAFTAALLARMADAGCTQIWFGLESASPELLRAMDKGVDLDVVDRILRDCDAVGIGVHLLLLHGYPGETDAQAERTVDYVRDRAQWVDSVSYTDFILFSATPIFDELASAGRVLDDDVDRLLQYRFEHREPAERAAVRARHQRLAARLQAVVPQPLMHLSHVTLYSGHHGPREWRRLRAEMAAT